MKGLGGRLPLEGVAMVRATVQYYSGHDERRVSLGARRALRECESECFALVDRGEFLTTNNTGIY